MSITEIWNSCGSKRPLVKEAGHSSPDTKRNNTIEAPNQTTESPGDSSIEAPNQTIESPTVNNATLLIDERNGSTSNDCTSTSKRSLVKEAGHSSPDTKRNNTIEAPNQTNNTIEAPNQTTESPGDSSNDSPMDIIKSPTVNNATPPIDERNVARKLNFGGKDDHSRGIVDDSRFNEDTITSYLECVIYRLVQLTSYENVADAYGNFETPVDTQTQSNKVSIHKPKRLIIRDETLDVNDDESNSDDTSDDDTDGAARHISDKYTPSKYDHIVNNKSEANHATSTIANIIKAARGNLYGEQAFIINEQRNIKSLSEWLENKISNQIGGMLLVCGEDGSMKKEVVTCALNSIKQKADLEIDGSDDKVVKVLNDFILSCPKDVIIIVVDNIHTHVIGSFTNIEHVKCFIVIGLTTIEEGRTFCSGRTLNEYDCDCIFIDHTKRSSYTNFLQSNWNNIASSDATFLLVYDSNYNFDTLRYLALLCLSVVENSVTSLDVILDRNQCLINREIVDKVLTVDNHLKFVVECSKRTILIGRSDEFTKLVTMINNIDKNIIYVKGMPGIGKTLLVTNVANTLVSQQKYTAVKFINEKGSIDINGIESGQIVILDKIDEANEKIISQLRNNKFIKDKKTILIGIGNVLEFEISTDQQNLELEPYDLQPLMDILARWLCNVADDNAIRLLAMKGFKKNSDIRYLQSMVEQCVRAVRKSMDNEGIRDIPKRPLINTSLISKLSSPTSSPSSPTSLSTSPTSPSPSSSSSSTSPQTSPPPQPPPTSPSPSSPLSSTSTPSEKVADVLQAAYTKRGTICKLCIGTISKHMSLCRFHKG